MTFGVFGHAKYQLSDFLVNVINVTQTVINYTKIA